MGLIEYIEKHGDEFCAELWGANVRTVKSWRYGERAPRRQMAKIIVERSPVTYAGIYQMPETEAA